MLELKKMFQDDYDEYIKDAIIEYAEAGVKSKGISIDEALKHAKKEFNQLLPDALESKDHFLYLINNDEDKNIGIMWFAAVSNYGDNEAFLYDIKLNEEYRGKGYGRESMKLLESKVAKLNLEAISLHVFLENNIACSLYNKMGYQEIQRGKSGIIMQKVIKKDS